MNINLEIIKSVKILKYLEGPVFKIFPLSHWQFKQYELYGKIINLKDYLLKFFGIFKFNTIWFRTSFYFWVTIAKIFIIF